MSQRRRSRRVATSTRPAPFWSTGLFAALLTACSADYLPFSGGALEGTVAPIPAEWSTVANAGVVQLETQPSAPYSINIWVVAMDEALYLHAGANRTTWVEHIEADSRVRLGYEGTIYELAARRVSEQGEFDRFSDAYEVKYDRRPRNENVGEAYLFRLTPR